MRRRVFLGTVVAALVVGVAVVVGWQFTISTQNEGEALRVEEAIDVDRTLNEASDEPLAVQSQQGEFYGLQLQLPPEWTVDLGSEAGDLYSEIQYHDRKDCPPGARYCPLVTIFDISTSKWEDLGAIVIEDGVLVADADCRSSAYLPPVLIGEVTIDGETAQLYEHASCLEYEENAPYKRSWVILSKNVVITDQSAGDGARSEGIDEILANATWA